MIGTGLAYINSQTFGIFTDNIQQWKLLPGHYLKQ